MSLFKSVIKQIEEASKFIGADERIINRLKKPKKVLSFKIAIGKKKYSGYRVQYNDARGPFKGGIRFHRDVNLDEIKALSAWMALKTAVVNIPMGGSKGGVAVDPAGLSLENLEKLSREYIRKVYNHIGPWRDIPAPDVNTNAGIMGWMMDEYSKIKGEFTPAVVTGKPLEIGGSHGRTEATGLGGVFVLLDFLQKKYNSGFDPSNFRIAIQGFGNVGSSIAKFLYEKGFKIVAISDAKGGIYNKNGFNVFDIERCVKEKRSVTDCYCVGKICETPVNHQNITNKDLLESDVDILIPAALENQITEINANNIKAKIILEMANGPIDRKADEILKKKNIIIIPDILANAGGVVVSYFEWAQNLQGYYWKEEIVSSRLKKIMSRGLSDVMKVAEKYGVDMRMAAYILAVGRIVEAMKLRGEF